MAKQAPIGPSMLYWGDNLGILRDRDKFPSESIDLVYLHPPFKSNQDYKVRFAEQNGSRSTAQIQAFTDTWRWDVAARHAFDSQEASGSLRRGSPLAKRDPCFRQVGSLRNSTHVFGGGGRSPSDSTDSDLCLRGSNSSASRR